MWICHGSERFQLARTHKTRHKLAVNVVKTHVRSYHEYARTVNVQS